MTIKLLAGDARDVLPTLAADSVHCVVTSPPYYGLRDYGTALWDGGDAACSHVVATVGDRSQRKVPLPNPPSGWTTRDATPPANSTSRVCHCGAVRIDRQIGLEATPDEYLATMVAVFREVRRVLRPDGTCWVNMGDSYASSGKSTPQDISERNAAYNNGQSHARWDLSVRAPTPAGLAAKQLLLMPARLALALQADGWWVRSDIIWCLSGGTRVYARTQKGEMPMSIKDMVRLNPATVQLWTGERWTQVLGWTETPRPDRTYEIELRNGQRIGCTGNHEWPIEPCGNIRTDELKVGDIIRRCRLPEPAEPRSPSWLMDELAGWFVGLYIAEGSRYDGTINIASHSNETERFERLSALAAALDGDCAVHKTSDNGSTVALKGPMLWGLIDTYVSGELASGKHMHTRCWKRSNDFLRAVLDGYLAGDGHYDAANDRWRLGFCTNDELVADLRTIGARLGVSVRLRRHQHQFAGREFPGYRGEVRFQRSNHHNNRDDGEIVAIRESRARKFWDIGIEDADHLFALASGVLTHNSKPNPMPESCTDRPTSAHEHVFLLTRSARYYFDNEAIREPYNEATIGRYEYKFQGSTSPGRRQPDNRDERYKESRDGAPNPAGRSCRNVWTIATSPFSAAHFATFPPELAERCIRAGTSERGACSQCGAPWRRITERNLDNVPTRMATKRAPVDCEAMAAYLRERREALGLSRAAIDAALGTRTLYSWFEGRPAGIEPPTPEQWTKLKDVLALDVRFDEQIYGTVEVEITDHSPSKAPGVRTYAKAWNAETTTTGWQPGCDHNADVVPCTILDPFIGSGTTALVADRLQRDCIGIDLNVDYTRMAMDRCIADAPLFTSFPPAEDPEESRMADLFADAAE